MTQQKVLEFLKQNKDKWFTVKQISKSMGVSTGSIGANIKKLREYKMLLFKEKRFNSYYYKHKH